MTRVTRFFALLAALLIAVPMLAPASVRCDTNSDNISFGDNFEGTSSFTVHCIFRTQAGATSTMARLFAKNTTATGTRGWGIRVHNGSAQGLRLNWFRDDGGSGTEEGQIADASASGMLTNGTWYSLLVVYDSTKPGGDGNSHADSKVRVFLNGVECVTATGESIGYTVTGPTANIATAFTIGKDAGSATNNSAFFDIAEFEYSASAVASASGTATSLYNSGNFKRLRDLGVTVSTYHDFFGHELATFDDKAANVDGTGTGIANGGGSTTHVDHAPMWAPIAEFARPHETCYDATSGGSLVANNANVSRWEDQSGRKLHLTAASGEEPVLRKGPYDFKPSVFFDKFKTSDWTPQATGLLIDGVRLNPGAFTVAGVVSGRGWRADLNGTSANNPAGFNTVWSVDGNSNPSTRLVFGIDSSGTEYSTGMVRTPNAANNATGPVKGSTGTPSGQLFVPTSPSYVVHSSDGTTIYVGVNDLSANNAGSLTQAYAAANSSGGILVGKNGSNVNFNADVAAYALKFYNRAITQAERESLRDTWDTDGLFTKSPRELWFGMGSSSAWGQEAAYGRELGHYLWHTNGRARSAWIYNYASPRARLDVDSTYTTTTANTVPKHDTHAVDTIDVVQGYFPALPVRLITWGGINDLAGAAGAPTAAQSAADTLTKLNTYLANRITAIGASRIRRSVVFTAWVNTDFAGGELTQRTAYNAGLFTDAGYHTNWDDVVDLRSTVLDNMTTAGATYTSDSKHPNETAFMELIGPLLEEALVPVQQGMRNRSRWFTGIRNRSNP